MKSHRTRMWTACGLLLFTLPGAGILAVDSSAEANPQESEVTAPPPGAVRDLGLDPFYKKYTSAGGLPVISSGNVSDFALLEADA